MPSMNVIESIGVLDLSTSVKALRHHCHHDRHQCLDPPSVLKSKLRQSFRKLELVMFGSG
ncbi:hypothetical protein FRX31_032667 [Thalictrum thalictroides]|uniref:Uncharacterized protein n=1 Tax=Thalictrum thalictroides TaxID=46969 RepID=A0A7J6V002_THATH|nr:hypothetical protein FRX31_032667 [Thalictrum thalictroides]